MMRTIVAAASVLPLFALAVPAEAKLPPKIAEAIESAYPPAEPHRGLDSAYVQPEPAKLKGAAVVMKGGVPAERARFFISWDEYDYRGVAVDLRRGKEEVTTRRGAPYAYLKPGDVMLVAGIKELGGTVYLKLLSAEVYVPENRRSEKRHSRVAVMLGFTLPKAILADDDAPAALAAIGEWLKPFPNCDEAKAYAMKIRREGGAEGMNEARGSDGERMKGLEEKIEAARRQMEEAEREMKELKGRRR